MKTKISNNLSRVTSINHVKKIIASRRYDGIDQSKHLLLKELKKIYEHEVQLLVAIDLMMMGASTFELVNYLTVHLKYTRDHIKHLEENFPDFFDTQKSDIIMHSAIAC
ncbi:DUF892 family protein [Flavobacterium dankookense]|uniref:Uncharacterized protein DUF892 n=1 Tax=Flavobacterium dankookense TaxID=706186 RepID=A0A4R6QF86_9FLAO|nr:DUF892 family protein [Flavobacterium dankookense]TDP60937.1 uncharacterized protein DUF892 [Flavobacterium dankookense]